MTEIKRGKKPSRQPREDVRETTPDAFRDNQEALGVKRSTERTRREDPDLDSKIDRLRDLRKRRTTSDGMLLKLQVPGAEDPNYKYVWPVDRDGALSAKEADGYEFVLNEDGSQVREPAGLGEEHVLMRIPMVIYDEDYGRRQEERENLDKYINNYHNEGKGADGAKTTFVDEMSVTTKSKPF